MMIPVATNEPAATDLIVRLDALDDMHRKGQPGNPWPTVAFVLQVELNRRRVIHLSFGTEIVDRLNEQVRFPAH